MPSPALSEGVLFAVVQDDTNSGGLPWRVAAIDPTSGTRRALNSSTRIVMLSDPCSTRPVGRRSNRSSRVTASPMPGRSWTTPSKFLLRAADVKDLSESRVLIVDDAKVNIDILVEALRDEYKLSVALDGAAALCSIEKSTPDLVLLDIVMPGLNGYEVCRQLRAQESTRDLPVMFLSSLEDVKDKTQGFEVGGNDYLTKPFEVLEVKARVRSLLKAKAYTDAIREAMARDLKIAREIQMGILPADVAAITRHRSNAVVLAAVPIASSVQPRACRYCRACSACTATVLPPSLPCARRLAQRIGHVGSGTLRGPRASGAAAKWSALNAHGSQIAASVA